MDNDGGGSGGGGGGDRGAIVEYGGCEGRRRRRRHWSLCRSVCPPSIRWWLSRSLEVTQANEARTCTHTAPCIHTHCTLTHIHGVGATRKTNNNPKMTFSSLFPRRELFFYFLIRKVKAANIQKV